MSKPNSFHLIIKPTSAVCNLNCTYCYYLPKKKLFPHAKSFVIDDQLLELLIKQYIQGQTSQTIDFTWQGGEPALLGLDFFKKVIVMQKKYAGSKVITNDLQTNGTLLDDKWCVFLREHGFLVGLSVDGPPYLHDKYRLDSQGNKTCEKVLAAAKLLNKHHVDFNTLTVINRENAKYPEEVYLFLRDEIGAKYMQFIPCVERTNTHLVTEYSVIPEDYGDFLCGVFDHWYQHDLRKVFVMNFEATLNLLLQKPSPLCFFAQCCGKSLAVEHDGSVYSCDHFVSPEYQLGNIKEHCLAELAASANQEKFGLNKLNHVSNDCRSCAYFRLCYGECPKNRFVPDEFGGGAAKNYLCKGLKKYFAHVMPYMLKMAQALKESGLI